MHTGINMAPQERRRRMMAMRDAVAANNIYRWGSELLSAVAETRAGSVPCSVFTAADDLYAKRTAMLA
jgi:trehalose-6-phosphate synthase